MMKPEPKHSLDTHAQVATILPCTSINSIFTMTPTFNSKLVNAPPKVPLTRNYLKGSAQVMSNIGSASYIIGFLIGLIMLFIWLFKIYLLKNIY